MMPSGGAASSINVDVVGLPNILKKDLATLSQDNIQKEETAEKDEMVLRDNTKIVKDKTKLVQELKKSIDDKENYLKRIKIIKGLKQNNNSVTSSGKGMGSGTGNGDGSGQGTGSGEVVGSPYFTTIKELIRSYWNIPTWMRSEGLNAQITIRIGSNGELNSIELSKPSGDSDFDKLAFQAVKSAAPFTPPPPSIKDLVDNGIVLSFP